ncbi:hypothetical protein M0R45_024244 [Rubus argutus]|uniref:Uncharacterized protein n=1 Tax=Rubus argutus TaxID=59490 RepID=A0AAW1WQA4_RUBAR
MVDRGRTAEGTTGTSRSGVARQHGAEARTREEGTMESAAARRGNGEQVLRRRGWVVHEGNNDVEDGGGHGVGGRELWALGSSPDREDAARADVGRVAAGKVAGDGETWLRTGPWVAVLEIRWCLGAGETESWLGRDGQRAGVIAEICDC